MCVCEYVCIYMFVYIYIYFRRHVPSGLAGCCSFPPSPPVNAGHTLWLWFAERYLMLQISPTPLWNHILKPLGELFKVNTANWLGSLFKYKIFDKYNSFTIKKTLNCRVWFNKINNNIIL